MSWESRKAGVVDYAVGKRRVSDSVIIEGNEDSGGEDDDCASRRRRRGTTAKKQEIKLKVPEQSFARVLSSIRDEMSEMNTVLKDTTRNNH